MENAAFHRNLNEVMAYAIDLERQLHLIQEEGSNVESYLDWLKGVKKDLATWFNYTAVLFRNAGRDPDNWKGWDYTQNLDKFAAMIGPKYRQTEDRGLSADQLNPGELATVLQSTEVAPLSSADDASVQRPDSKASPVDFWSFKQQERNFVPGKESIVKDEHGDYWEIRCPSCGCNASKKSSGKFYKGTIAFYDHINASHKDLDVASSSLKEVFDMCKVRKVDVGGEVWETPKLQRSLI